MAYTAAGSLTFELRDDVTHGQEHELSARAATAPENNNSAIIWVCGYAMPPPGFETMSPDKTTIPPALLPAPCRDKKKE